MDSDNDVVCDVIVVRVDNVVYDVTICSSLQRWVRCSNGVYDVTTVRVYNGVYHVTATRIDNAVYDVTTVQVNNGVYDVTTV